MANKTINREAEIAQLKEQRDKLQERLNTINADYRQGLSADSDEQSIELENAEVLEGIARATAEELQQIEEKLASLS